MLPVIVLAAIAVPLLIVGYIAMRRTKAAGEHPANEDEQTRRRTEDEFAASEAYQEEWREEERKHRPDTLL